MKIEPIHNPEEVLRDSCRRENPWLWKKLTPRKIRQPDGYYAVWKSSAMLYSLMLGMSEEDPGSRVGGCIAARLMEFDMPVFFVGEQLLEAALVTEPPLDTKLSDIKWPFEAMTFALPNGFAERHFGFRTGFVSCALLRPGSLIIPIPDRPGKYSQVDNGADRTAIGCNAYYRGQPYPAEYTSTEPNEKEIRSLVEVSSVNIGDTRSQDADRAGGVTLTREQDAHVLRCLSSLVLQLLMVMQCRPELIEKGTQVARSDMSKQERKSGEPIWTPNFIGRSYRYVTERDSVGTGTSKTRHWRRGHTRLQRYGPNWSKERNIWIEPVIVNLGAEQ